MKLSLLLILFCLNARAATYYVSTSGSDASNGASAGTSWKTIAKINGRTFSPGDVISLNRGDVWREQLTVPSSGTVGNPITFSAYGSGAKPIINGADITTGWVNAGGNVWSVNCPNATTSRAMVVVAGTIFAEVASQALVNSTAKYYIDLAASPDKLYIYSVTDPNTITAEVSKRDWCIRAPAASVIKYVNFTNLDCRYAGNAGLALYATTGSQIPSYCTVDSCNFYANRFFGCVAYDGHSNDIFQNSTASYNGNGFYSWISDSLTVSHCSTAHNIHYVIGAGFTDGHGYGGFTAGDMLIENCESNDDKDGIDIEAGGGAKSAIIRYNYIHDAPNGHPGMAIGNLGAGGTIQVYYNLIVNCGGATAESFDSYIVNTGQVLVYNNTMYNNTANAGNGCVFLKYGNNFVFKNNIIMSDGGSFVDLFGVENPNLSTSDYNQFYQLDPTSSPYRFVYNGTNYTTLVNWIAATAQDIHSQSGDPLFTNKASDWTLLSGSPCINKGISVGLIKDILGNPIIGIPDMGAYEAQGACSCQ